MKKIILLLFAISLVAQGRTSDRIRLQELSQTNSTLLRKNINLEQTNDSLETVITQFEDLMAVYERRFDVQTEEIEYLNGELTYSKERIDKLNLLWYAVIFLFVLSGVFSTLYFRKRADKVHERQEIRTSKKKATSTAQLENVISSEMEKGFRTLYKIVHESNEILVSNNEKLSNIISKYESSVPEKVTETDQSERIVSLKGLDFENVKELDLSQDLHKSDQPTATTVESVPKARPSQSKATRLYSMSSAILPNSSHSCLTEYNSILRQINIGLFEQYEEEKRIEKFMKTFQGIRLSKNTSSSYSIKFSADQKGAFIAVSFGDESYILPWFESKLSDLEDIFVYKGTKSYTRLENFTPRQVLRFARIEPYSEGYRLLSRGNVI